MYAEDDCGAGKGFYVSSNHGLLKSGIDIFAEVSSRESSFLS
jgi:hypothetical protein